MRSALVRSALVMRAVLCFTTTRAHRSRLEGAPQRARRLQLALLPGHVLLASGGRWRRWGASLLRLLVLQLLPLERRPAGRACRRSRLQALSPGSFVCTPATHQARAKARKQSCEQAAGSWSGQAAVTAPHPGCVGAAHGAAAACACAGIHAPPASSPAPGPPVPVTLLDALHQLAPRLPLPNLAPLLGLQHTHVLARLCEQQL